MLVAHSKLPGWMGIEEDMWKFSQLPCQNSSTFSITLRSQENQENIAFVGGASASLRRPSFRFPCTFSLERR